MQKGIKYKDTTAMPGSQLYKFLSEKKLKEAEMNLILNELCSFLKLFEDAERHSLILE